MGSQFINKTLGASGIVRLELCDLKELLFGLVSVVLDVVEKVFLGLGAHVVVKVLLELSLEV